MAGRHWRSNSLATSGAFAAQTEDIQVVHVEAVDSRSGVLGDARRSDDLERIDGHALPAAHRISAISLRRWRNLLESGEVEVDWRAHFHPSARPPISTSALMFAVKGSDVVERPSGEMAVGGKRRSCAELGAELETTVDQTLIRGLVTAFRVYVSGLSSV